MSLVACRFIVGQVYQSEITILIKILSDHLKTALIVSYLKYCSMTSEVNMVTIPRYCSKNSPPLLINSIFKSWHSPAADL